MSDPYKINISAVNQFARCQFRWFCIYVLNRVPVKEAEPLAFGRMLHEVFEKDAKYGNMEVAIDEVRVDWGTKAAQTVDPFERDVRYKAILQMKELEEPLAQWRDQYEFETPTLEIEEPFEFPHPDDSDIILLGRPDRVGVMDGRIWHIQHRGLHSGINFGIYVELAKRHYHEHVYAEALSQKYPNFPYGGTLFNLVRKLKFRTKKTKANPDGEAKSLSEMFFQHPMTIDLNSSLHKHIMYCVRMQAYKMRDAELAWKLRKVIPVPNEQMNGGMYGNSPDEYFRVLIGEIELDDNRYFKTRINPYEVISEV